MGRSWRHFVWWWLGASAVATLVGIAKALSFDTSIDDRHIH